MYFHHRYAFLGLIIVITIIASVYTKTVSTPTQAISYLSQFGYLPAKYQNSTVSDLLDFDTWKNSIMDFQRFAGIKVTGELDKETIKFMSLPRCGVADKVNFGHHKRSKRYAFYNIRWKFNNLTYRILTYPNGLRKTDVDFEIHRAFGVWSEHTDLTFTKSSSTIVTISIRFESGDHGDTDKFDGSSGTLGHAFPPQFGGAVHFDKDELWTINRAYGINLFQVAVHEFGHALGLKHSDVESSIMAPFYKKFTPNFKLDPDDIAAIQMLYGKKSLHSVPNNYLVCKDPKIDAIFNSADGQLFAFKNDKCFKLNGASVAKGYPKLISVEWPGLPANIDAAFTLKNRKTYFLKGTQFWRYNEYHQLDFGYPHEIRYGFPGVPDNVDAAVVCGVEEKICFFKNRHFWSYDASKAKVSVFPISNSKHVPYDLDAALKLSNGNTYLFKGDKFYSVHFNSKPIDLHYHPLYQYSVKSMFDCKENVSRAAVRRQIL